jgi:dephospho-CoA kinase
MADTPRSEFLVVGLIGGIGSGKSLVASCFARLGARVIDADALGHEALRQPEIRDRIVQRWGQGILNDAGEIARRKLAAIVFADAAERQALERLVFPWIERRIREELHRARRDPQVRVAVLDAAILLETGWDRHCDVIVFVDAPLEQRLERLTTKRGWTIKEVEARENAQLPIPEKRSRADVVVGNDASPDQTCIQVERLWAQWQRSLPVSRREPAPEPMTRR